MTATLTRADASTGGGGGQGLRSSRPGSDGPHIRHGRVDDLLFHALTPQALQEPLDPGILVEPFEVLPQSLADVGPDQRLVAREPEDGGYALEVLHHILGHPDADGRHRTVLLEPVTERLSRHRDPFPPGWKVGRR